MDDSTNGGGLGRRRFMASAALAGADGLPGLVIERYAETLVLKLYTAAWLPHLRDVIAGLQSVQPFGTLVLRMSRKLVPLTEQQHRAVFDELAVKDPLEREPGKMNINTVSPTFLYDLLELYGADPVVAEEILFMRDSRPEGIVSMLDLKSIPQLTDELLLQLGSMFDTRSNVYTISSKGRSLGIGIEVEMIAVVDRSTLPIRILEYREQ